MGWKWGGGCLGGLLRGVVVGVRFEPLAVDGEELVAVRFFHHYKLRYK
jgi:hypothetical protein